MQKKLRENLKLDTLLALIETPGEFGAYAKRRKLSVRPNPAQIKARFANTEWLMAKLRENAPLADQWAELFEHLPLLAWEHLKLSPCLDTHEFFEIKSFLWVYGKLRKELHTLEGPSLHPLPDLARLFALLDPEGNGLPSFRISELYDKRLLKLSQQRSDLANKLKLARNASLEEARNKLDTPNLKEEFILSRHQEDLISKLQQSTFFAVSSESLANISFRLADNVKTLRYKTQLELLNQERKELEDKIRRKLTAALFKHFSKLETAWKSCEELVWEFSLARFALRHGCCIPRLNTKGGRIEIAGAVNLPLKLALQSQNRHYQSLDLCFEESSNLLTGPNMGGKTTALITLGQLCHLASWAIPLPAKSAELPIFDDIFYNHDNHDLSESLSSFGREVVSFVQFIASKGKKLILLDEFARGTNPEEGEALCLGVLRYLHKHQINFVAATHFKAPTNLPGLTHYSIKGISPKALQDLEGQSKTALEERLKHLSEAMDYQLQRLDTNQDPPKCALRIASILGLPDEISNPKLGSFDD